MSLSLSLYFISLHAPLTLSALLFILYILYNTYYRGVFLGMSLISLTCTHWMFAAWGRKTGVLVGIVFGIAGVGVGTIAVYQKSAPLLIFANVLFGAATGMGMYLRFAAVEVVAPVFRERAVSWVLAGGCIAAFAKPPKRPRDGWWTTMI